VTNEFKQACIFAGIEATKRQWRRWCRSEGLAYRLARHFDPIHERRKVLNDEIDARNRAREIENNRRAAIAEGQPLELEERLPVPVTREEIKTWLDATSEPGAKVRPLVALRSAS
jgi:hypothetical protein